MIAWEKTHRTYKLYVPASSVLKKISQSPSRKTYEDFSMSPTTMSVLVYTYVFDVCFNTGSEVRVIPRSRAVEDDTI